MSSVDQRYDEAVALKEAGKIEEAVARLEGLLQEDPKHVLAHAALSVFYGKLEQFEQAVQHAQQVCELDPEDPFSFVAMSLICQKAGRLREAEQASMQAHRLQGAQYG